MLDVADMSAREVDNDEVVCIDGLLRRDNDNRCKCGGQRSGRQRMMTTMEQMILSLLLLL